MKKHQVLIPLGFGDEGKGSWVEYFAQKEQSSLGVRYNGGCQGMHYVHFGNNVFGACQFSAATIRRNDLQTLISEVVPVVPNALLCEGRELIKFGIDNPLGRLFVMNNSPILTPAHNFLCETREYFSKSKIGTTGIGVRELLSDIKADDKRLVLRIKDLLDNNWRNKLNEVIEYQLLKARKLFSEYNYLIQCGVDEYRESNPMNNLIEKYELFLDQVGGILSETQAADLILGNKTIFEPAQGTLLDSQYGFKPHVTSTCTTVAPAIRYCSGEDSTFYGLFRAYSVRHGSGLFVTGCNELKQLQDDNLDNRLQGLMRYGWLDLVMLRYAIDVNHQLMHPYKINRLAVSCVDQLTGLEKIKICIGYHHNLQENNRIYFYFTDDDLISSIKPESASEIDHISLLLSECRPEYIELSGWYEDIYGCNEFGKLPVNAQRLINYISDSLEIPIGFVSVGPRLEQKIEINV